MVLSVHCRDVDNLCLAVLFGFFSEGKKFYVTQALHTTDKETVNCL